MTEPASSAAFLPLPLPDDRTERVVLVSLRRMAAHGIRDASTALLMLDCFGARFRRPLVLLRAFVVELAQASHRPIKIAPCCAMRMTADEGLILEILRTARQDLPAAEHSLVLLTASPRICEPLSAAAVFGRAIRDDSPLPAI